MAGSTDMSIKTVIKKKAPRLWKNLQSGRNTLMRLCRPVKIGEISNTAVSRKMGTDRGQAIDRYYIEYFLEKHSGLIKGDILEIADSSYSVKYGATGSRYHVLTYDRTAQEEADLYVGDLTDLSTLRPNSIDCFICTQTLNFIYDISAAVKGMRFVLRDGGTVLATMSGLSQISPYDYPRWGDYWRFTDQSVKKLFDEEFGEENVEVVTFGNLAASLAFLQGMSVEDMPGKSILDEKDRMYQIVVCVMARKRATQNLTEAGDKSVL